MKARHITILVCGLLLTVGGYYVWAAFRAHRNLVTLDVRNMEVRKVIRKIESQTWERILVEKNVQGNVSLRVRKMPLEDVLRIVEGQTDSRASVIYPLYSNAKSLSALQRGLRGEIDPAAHGWTNYEARALFPGGPMFAGGRPGGPQFTGLGGTNAPEVISFQIINKDVSFATLVFSRFAQVRIVPEDGTTALVNLTLNRVPLTKAIDQFAKSVRRKWTRLYALRGGGFGPGRAPQMAMRDSTNAPGPQAFGGPPPMELTDAQREEMRKNRETLEQELKQTLPPAEQARLDAEQQQRMKEFQEFQNMTPEQRRERMAQRGPGRGAMDSMMRDRLRNSSPEQRAQQTRRMLEMRQRMQQFQQGQGQGRGQAPGELGAGTPPPPPGR